MSDEKTHLNLGGEVDPDGLPLLRFPRKLKLTGGFSEHTGELFGLNWTDGLSDDWLSYQRIMGITSGYGPCIDPATGLRISPLSVNVTFRTDQASLDWNEYQPLPEHIEEQAEAIKARGGQIHEITVNPETPESDGEEVSDDEADGNEEVEEERPRLQVADGQIDVDFGIKKGEPPAINKHELIVGVIAGLDPKVRDNWTTNGKPDATVLSAALGQTVTAAERDRAWDAHLEASGNVYEIVENVLKLKGARYLRQCCIDRDLQTARSGDEMVKILGSALSIDEARKL